jgi:glycosyltransferase involved in cell wall biosynthesis
MIITLFSNTSWSLFNFRKDFIVELIKKKHEVIIVSNKDLATKKLIKIGCKYVPINFNTTSRNPFNEISCLLKIFYLVFKSNSDIFINFTIKPCIYFGLINFFFNKNSISMFDGLGRSFINNNFFSKLMIKILKISQFCTRKIILVNKDDITFFIKNKIVKKKKIFHLRAPGLDVDNYKFKKRVIKKNKKLVFAFISRVMIEKGIIHFLKSAEKIKKNFKVDFIVMGPIPTTQIKDTIKKFVKKKIIKYYKKSSNVKERILSSDCIVLPSYYREGLPRILQESNYLGRICITTDNVGCKDVIIDNYNGFIIKKKSVDDLVLNITKVIKMNKSKLSLMEKNAHFFIKKNFNKDQINYKFINLINETAKI